jgi:acyl-CoA hydrolase
MENKHPAASQVTLTQLMGPLEANGMGNVHGGIIMKLCDEAGGMAAAKHARRPAVTVTVDSMSFRSPVSLGNLLKVEAQVTWVGRTSMETRVHVSAENVITGQVTHTNTAYFVYVALDDDGRPMAVPGLELTTDEERDMFARAEARQAYRLEQRRQGNL